jgi:glucose-1-phosphate thymidylyltransferase
MYDATVFDKIKTLVPSGRGELEITDVNNAYIREGTMTFSYLEGWWTDAGTFESLLRAANLVAQSSLKPTLSAAEVANAVEGAVRI